MAFVQKPLTVYNLLFNGCEAPSDLLWLRENYAGERRYRTIAPVVEAYYARKDAAGETLSLELRAA